jgi:DNA-directed RNA polymerase specialized sigma54-like protein
VPDPKLTDQQIIKNLQYVVADYAGQVQKLIEENSALVARNTALSTAAARRPADNSHKLRPAEVRQMRADFAAGLSVRELADTYGVHHVTVSRTVKGVYHAGVR